MKTGRCSWINWLVVAASFIVLVHATQAQSPLEVSDELLGLSPPRRPSAGQDSAAARGARRDDGTLPVAGRLASVDVPLLFLFHPRMAEYYGHTQSFIRPIPDDLDGDGVRRLIQERRERASSAQAEVRHNIGAVSRSIRDLIARRQERRNEFYREQNELRATRERNIQRGRAGRESYEREFTAAMEVVNSEFWEDMRALDEEQTGLEERRRTLEEQLRRGEFLDDRERDRLLLRIEREIVAKIRSVVSAGEYALVFNSGYMSMHPQPELPDMPVGDLSYFLTPYLEFLRDRRDLRDPEVRGHVEHRVELWLERRDAILPKTYGSSSLNTFLLMGADDITPRVLDGILADHGVSRIRRAILRRKLF